MLSRNQDFRSVGRLSVLRKDNSLLCRQGDFRLRSAQARSSRRFPFLHRNSERASVSKNMDDLLLQQSIAICAVDCALKKKIGRSNLSYGIVRNRLKTLKESYDRCEQLHAQILSRYEEIIATERYFMEDCFNKLEDVYYAVSDYMANVLAQFESPLTKPKSSVSPIQQHDPARVTCQLSRLNLSKFSGEFCV